MFLEFVDLHDVEGWFDERCRDADAGDIGVFLKAVDFTRWICREGSVINSSGIEKLAGNLANSLKAPLLLVIDA